MSSFAFLTVSMMVSTPGSLYHSRPKYERAATRSVAALASVVPASKISMFDFGQLIVHFRTVGVLFGGPEEELPPKEIHNADDQDKPDQEVAGSCE